jgi:hypothetical protein
MPALPFARACRGGPGRTAHWQLQATAGAGLALAGGVHAAAPTVTAHVFIDKIGSPRDMASTKDGTGFFGEQCMAAVARRHRRVGPGPPLPQVSAAEAKVLATYVPSFKRVRGACCRRGPRSALAGRAPAGTFVDVEPGGARPLRERGRHVQRRGSLTRLRRAVRSPLRTAGGQSPPWAKRPSPTSLAQPRQTRWHAVCNTSVHDATPARVQSAARWPAAAAGHGPGAR